MRAIVVLAFVSCALIACAHGLPQHRPMPSPEGNPGFPGQQQHLRPSPLGKPDSNNPQLRLRPSPAIKPASQQYQQPPLKVPQENGQHSSPSADKSPQPPFEGHLRPTPIKKHPMQSPKIRPSSFPGRQEHPSFPTRSPRSPRPHQSLFLGKLHPSPFMQKQQQQHLRPSPLGKPNNPQLPLRPSPAIKPGSQQHPLPQENGQHLAPGGDKLPQPLLGEHLRPTPIREHPQQSPMSQPSSFPGSQEHPSFPTRSPRSLRPHQSPFPGKLRPSPFMQKPRPSPLHHEGDFVVRPTPPPMRPPRPTRSTPSFPKRLLPSRGMPRPSQFPGQILSPHASPALRPPHSLQHQQAGPVRPSMLHHKQAGPAIRPTPPLMKPFDQPTGRTHAN